MPKFSNKSLQRLKECHPDLQRLMNEVIKIVDITIITGYRSNKEQNEKYKQGLSNAKAGQSKHNVFPSLAVDIAPYPINFNDIERFKQVAKVIMDKAKEMDISLIYGGEFKSFHGDFGHFELKGVKDELKVA